jgi:hypothetical protein
MLPSHRSQIQAFKLLELRKENPITSFMNTSLMPLGLVLCLPIYFPDDQATEHLRIVMKHEFRFIAVIYSIYGATGDIEPSMPVSLH